MKNLFGSFLVLTLTLTSIRAFAFPPSIDLNGGTFRAGQACADLGIAAGDNVDTFADYSHFIVTKWTPGSNPSSREKVLFKFAVPSEGAYVFYGAAGLQSAHQFLSHGFSGENIYRFSVDSLGRLHIFHFGPQSPTQCLLLNNSGG